MPRFKIFLGLTVLALAVFAGYQVATVEIENVLLKDDIQDLASQFDTRTGYAAPKSDGDYRDMVVRKANEHGIDLQPGQVTVERSGSGRSPSAFWGSPSISTSPQPVAEASSSSAWPRSVRIGNGPVAYSSPVLAGVGQFCCVPSPNLKSQI